MTRFEIVVNISSPKINTIGNFFGARAASIFARSQAGKGTE
jgi:hypothetical protein